MKQTVESQFASKTNSVRILKKMKRERYRDIFVKMNPDETGQIVYQRIDQDKLNPNIQNLIQPILDELESLDQPLNFEEFEDAMERLMETLNPTEKNVILAPKKRWEQALKDLPKPANHPIINRRYSSVTRAPPADASEKPIYARLMEKKTKYEEKVKKQKEEAAAKELQDCTFKPSINNYKVLVADDSQYYMEDDFNLFDSSLTDNV